MENEAGCGDTSTQEAEQDQSQPRLKDLVFKTKWKFSGRALI